MITEMKTRYEVRYEDSKGIKWCRGRESSVYEYEEAKLYVEILKKKDMKNIKIVEITESYKVIETM